MPHATSATGFQAFILCGPGASLDTFTSNAKEFPKALVPIANRPMVWYALDWCYRMGVTDLTLITPPDASQPLTTALAQNPYLTSLPAPRPTVLAPAELTLTTGTAELFRIPAIQDAITNDFIVLSCDIICELNGTALLETWMTMQGTLVGGFDSSAERHGGLTVHYQTKNSEEGGIGVKKEETDFIGTTVASALPSLLSTQGLLGSRVRNLVMTMPTDTLKDVLEERQNLRVRYALLRKYRNIKMFTTHRDAHIYFFPRWVKYVIARNDTFDSLSEDLLGCWAKAEWQDGFSEKIGIVQALHNTRRKSQPSNEPKFDEVDLRSMSSTFTRETVNSPSENAPTVFASRVRDNIGKHSPPFNNGSHGSRPIPPILTYVHPSAISEPTIRRVDTVPLLLSLSLHLAKLVSLDEATNTNTPASPLAHSHKVHPTSTIPQRATVTRNDSLLDANVSVAEKSSIKECVIGANCEINSLARLTRCLLMEGVVVEEGVVLVGCVLGRRCRIGRGAELKECQVQGGFVVEEGVNAKGEIFRAFESLSDDEGMDLLQDKLDLQIRT